MTHLDLSDEFLRSAKVNLDAEEWRTSVSRSYYAVYHACVALFEHYGYHPYNFRTRGQAASMWEHRIITVQIGRVFWRQLGLLSRARARSVLRIYRLRLDADYRPNRPLGRKEAIVAYTEANATISAIKKGV